MFDLIIPCLFSHFKNIRKTLDSFKNQELINNIIIVLNNINNNDTNFDFLKDYKLKLKIVKIKDKMLPGIARQEGLRFVKSDYVVFHDADDEAHPDKLLILKNCFEKYKCDHILHLIQPIELDFLNYQLDKIRVVNDKELRKYYQKTKKCDFGDIIGKRCSQGLSAVRVNKIIDIEWLNIKSGEDKDFNIKSMLKGNKMLLVDCYLSKYDRYKIKIMKRYHPKAWEEFNNPILETK